MTAVRHAVKRGNGPRKSPLRVVSEIPPTTMGAVPAAGPPPPGPDSPVALRRVMISEYCQSLRARTNRKGRPFQDGTVSAYRDAVIALDAWMTSTGLEADFTGCDTAVLNRFFADYLAAHGQSGTNTKQRNLRHLFTWLHKAYDHPHPYTQDLNRYSPVRVRPSTLAQQFIADLLEVTGGGHASGVADVRDHAIIRVLTEGVRRTELTQVQTTDLSADLIQRPFIRVVPLKDAHGNGEGRIVALSPSTVRAILAYLRARRAHRRAAERTLWLGTRNRGPLTGSALARMLQRRAEQDGR